MNDYSSIIDHPHYQSKKRPHMPMIKRAAQFASFAALSGYEDAVEETARLATESVLRTENGEGDVSTEAPF